MTDDAAELGWRMNDDAAELLPPASVGSPSEEC